jgi:hypothetical protein
VVVGSLLVFKQYLYIILLILLVFICIGCNNVRMACTMNESKYIDKKDAKENAPTVTDKAKDCVNNPSLIVFKEF